MSDQTVTILLDQLRQQSYPLEVSECAADALYQCIRRIMEAVPEDEQVFVRADYDLVTSALCHPGPSANWAAG